MERGRGILQTVGSPPDLLAAAAKRDSDSDLETEELDKTQPQNTSGRTMNMKQEGPFLGRLIMMIIIIVIILNYLTMMMNLMIKVGHLSLIISRLIIIL